MKRGAPGRPLVLVMSDDDLVRWSAAEGLRECGYQVDVATSPHEALERCPPAAAVLLDHDSRQMDGLALTEILRDQCPLCAIVLMASDLTPELLRNAQESQISRVLAKPFSLEDLTEAIGSALARCPATPSPRTVARGETREEPRETGTSRRV